MCIERLQAWLGLVRAYGTIYVDHSFGALVLNTLLNFL